MSIALNAAGVELASPLVALSVSPGGRLWLEGDSTLHRYKTSAEEFKVTAKGHGSSDAEQLARHHGLDEFELTVPVLKLRSGEKGLDENLAKAMKAVTFPNIAFRMTSYEVSPTLAIKIHGLLAMAGVEKPVDIDAASAKTPNGLHLVGTKSVLMSDYGIKPPVLMLGTIRTANSVAVKFDFELEARALPLPTP